MKRFYIDKDADRQYRDIQLQLRRIRDSMVELMSSNMLSEDKSEHLGSSLDLVIQSIGALSTVGDRK